MIDALRQKWDVLLRTWSVDPRLVDETFEDLCKQYSEPCCYYHTLVHIQDVLSHVEALSQHAQNLNAVKLSAWLHDVIYDPKSFDNEERSAAYAEVLCKKLSIPDGVSAASLILKTKTHKAGNNPDAQVLVDADLAILGANESAYQTYADQIRQEYAWVPGSEYRSGRIGVLRRFVARPRIFHLLGNLEVAARRNLAAEFGRLRDGLAIPLNSEQIR